MMQQRFISIFPLLALFAVLGNDPNSNNRGHCMLVEGRVLPSTAALLFAQKTNSHGGFNSAASSRSGKPTKRNKSNKGKNTNTQQSSNQPRTKIETIPTTMAVEDVLANPQSRMEYIAKCIEQADVSPILGNNNHNRRRRPPPPQQQSSSPSQQDQLEDVTTTTSIDDNAICYVDNFLGPQFILAMRAEAEALLAKQGVMVPSQSTRWDDVTQSVIAYDKEGVLSTQIEGGPEGYAATPLLVEYIVTLTKHLSQKINAIVPDDYKLSGSQQTNKLAVCLGGGSKYDKHIDNLGDGQGDRRKMTALLYLQPPGSHADVATKTTTNTENDDDDDDDDDDNENENENDARGGYFRAYDVPDVGQVKVIAPKGDRLLLFWSDSLVHDVSPSFVQDEEKDRRWALTVWFLADEGGKIRATDADIERRHFGLG